MALKYRIEYDRYPVYQRKNSLAIALRTLLPLLMCILLIVLLFYSPTATRLRDLLLPGDPAITMEAFRQLSVALDHGEPLTDAMDVFCHAIMEVR